MMPTEVLIKKYVRRSYLYIEINIWKKVRTFERKLSSILSLFDVFDLLSSKYIMSVWSGLGLVFDLSLKMGLVSAVYYQYWMF